VSLIPFIANPIFATRALPTSAKIIRCRSVRCLNDAIRTDSIVDQNRSFVGVVTHRYIGGITVFYEGLSQPSRSP
jgi:hypothetical protein